MDKIKEILADLKANPANLFGLVYPYVLIVGISIGLIYIANMNNTERKKVLPRLPDSTIVNDFELSGERIEPAVDLKQAIISTPEIISKGETIYKNTCVTCHGETGKGDGIGGSTLNPKPRNFTILEGWKNEPKLTGIYTTLEEGIPNSAMISYKQLKADEKFALGHYIQTKFLPNAPKDTEDDLLVFDQKYQLSKGIKIAAQIPVLKAWDILIKESKEKTKIAQFNPDKESEKGAMILKRVIKNKDAAINWLDANLSWKESEESLRNYLSRKIYQNGFGKQIQFLNDEEWSVLFDYLVKKYNKV